MEWWYLSPHLDDAVYSCGGLIAAQVRRGQAVHIWTMCAGDPPAPRFSPFAQALHARWGTDGFETAALRRREDRQACALLGASWRHEDIPDCIYRQDEDGRFLYTSEETLFGPPHPAERPLLRRMTRLLEERLPDRARLVVPLTLGGHTDHRLVRRAAEALGRPLWYYPDYPYARSASAAELLSRLPASARLERTPLRAAEVSAWVRAMRLYASQLTSFWEDEAALEAEIRAWARTLGGALLWRT